MFMNRVLADMFNTGETDVGMLEADAGKNDW